MNLSTYIRNVDHFPNLQNFEFPWNMTDNIEMIVRDLMKNLSSDFLVKNDIAIHKNAIIESGSILKGPIIIGEGCLIASGAYLRGGVFLEKNIKIGPSCEVKSSFIFADTSLAHFNYVGNSLLGSGVNLEAGAVIANHFNEREDKTIFVVIEQKRMSILPTKFGAVVGDNSKIGANAVLSPGTILARGAVVGRLELVKEN